MKKNNQEKKFPSPDRDWRWLLIGWLAAVVILLAVAILAVPALINFDVGREASETASDQATVLNGNQLRAAVEFINNRQAQFEALKSALPKFVDPSL